MKKIGKVIETVLIVIGVIAPLWLFLSVILPEPTATVVVDIPGSKNQLVIREYEGFLDGGINFYLRRPWHFDRHLGSAGFNNRTCPIGSGDYELLWEENAVVVRYLFSRSKAEGYWAEVRLELSQ